ncbi:MAG: alpha/beta hydrolase [Verrucomicrobia bacterium]|nr:MAG: alpha/beta hydrolase [Verrucomicrobiota bacterium]
MQITTVDTPTLSIGCIDSGPQNGYPLLLLHGWPDDAQTWNALLPSLHRAGFRTFAPFLRGFGPTQFKDIGIFRCGQLTALAQDILDLADALNLNRFALVGHDWSARSAYIISALAPERISACVALSVGWGTNDSNQVLSLKQTQNYWYHWLMATERGEKLIREDRYRFTHYLWSIWSPNWKFSQEEFSATASSFENTDWTEVTLHSYRVRWGFAPRDSRYASLEAHIAANAIIHVPTLVLHGGGDSCNDPATSENKENFFAGFYYRSVLNGLGHFPQRENPEMVLAELLPFLDTYTYISRTP